MGSKSGGCAPRPLFFFIGVKATMPLGQFPDFDACLRSARARAGISDPEAYCGAIKRAIEGQAEITSENPLVLPLALVEELCQSCAEYMVRFKMTALKVSNPMVIQQIVQKLTGEFTGEIPLDAMRFQAVATRDLDGIEIFAAGTWTDSDGKSKQWTQEDLHDLVTNFKDAESTIPLKVGHTTDEFNSQLADQLGLPIGFLTGEHGHGQMRLGEIKAIRQVDDKLVADFTHVPEAVADLVEGGQFNAVSVEIELDEEQKPAFTAVALLGAEAPAIPDLTSPSMSRFSESTRGSWLTFQFQDGATTIDIAELTEEFRAIRDQFEETIKGKKGARVFRALWKTLEERFASITGKSHHAAPQGSENGWPSHAWLDRAMAAARAFPQLTDPAAFCGSVWFRNDPVPRVAFDTAESSIATAVRMGPLIQQWLQKQLETVTPAQAEPQDGQTLAAPESEGGTEPTMTIPATFPGTTSGGGRRFAEHLTDEMMQEMLSLMGMPMEATAEMMMDMFRRVMDMMRQAGMEMPMMPDGAMPPDMPGSGHDPGMMPNDMMPMQRQQQKRIDGLEQYVKTLEHKERVSQYQRRVEGLRVLSGSAEELAKELAGIAETVNSETAEKVLEHYQQADNVFQASGLTETIGYSRQAMPDTQDGFHDEIEEYARANNISFEKAVAQFAKTRPGDFAKYRVRIKEEMHPTNGRVS